MLQSIEHLAYKVAGLAGSIYALEKTNILNQIMRPNDGEFMLAMKTGAVLLVSEYASDQVLSRLWGQNLNYNLNMDLKTMGMQYATNVLMLFAMDKLNIDSMIVKRGSTPEMRAIQMGILFVIVQEISTRLLSMIYEKY